MHVADTWCNAVNPGRNKVIDVLRACQDPCLVRISNVPSSSSTGRAVPTGQIARVRYPVLAALNTAYFRFDGNLSRVAILSKTPRLLEIFLPLVVAHVHHDGIKLAEIGRILDLVYVLRMIQMDGDGH